MWRGLFRSLSPPGRRARLSTLIFHRVVPEPDPLFPGEVDAAQFDAICGWLKDWFNVLPLDQAIARLKAGSLPSRAMAITFDDGYADNASVAMPILQSHGLTATFFVAAGFLDGGRMWNDSLIESVRLTPLDAIDMRGLGLGEQVSLSTRDWSDKRQAIDALIAHAKYLAPAARTEFVAAVAQRSRSELPHHLMMSSDEVRSLRRGGMGVGAHTMSHPILARIDDETARAEMSQSKRQLEELLAEDVTLFAYPNGRPAEDYLPHHAAMARECGFAAAVSTAWGTADRHADIYQLPRFTPWDRTRWRYAMRLAGQLRS